MYMSYCRFEGTKAELRACLGEAQEHINGEAEYEVSAREIDCFRDIVNDLFDFLNDNCLIDEYGMIDQEALDEVCEAMAKARTDDEDEEEEF